MASHRLLIGEEFWQNKTLRFGVYFAMESSGRYIKIGVSYRPGARIRFLRYQAKKKFRSKDVVFIGIVPGGCELEEKLHKKFAAYKVSGEWFHAAALGEYIESCRPLFVPVEYFYYQKRFCEDPCSGG